MKKILLLDFDHTLYPSTLNTLKAVDDRINLYMQTFLGYDAPGADALRLSLWDEFGTTLRGLEVRHGVDRDHYCDFIHAIEAEHLPPPDAKLQAWLMRLTHPLYIFTNARVDWAVRGLQSMGLASMLPEEITAVASLKANPTGTKFSAVSGALPGAGAPRFPKLQGIFDIVFMGWEGKPNPPAYAKVDAHLRAAHGNDIRIVFADDRCDNLEAARERGWGTVWIIPHDGDAALGGKFDKVVMHLTELNPESLA